MLTTEAFAAIVSIRAVRHKGSLPRLEMTVTTELGDTLKRLIRRQTSKRTPYLMRMLRKEGLTQSDTRCNEAMSKWRVMAYRPYMDRVRVDDPNISSKPAWPLGDGLLSLNVNGFDKKKSQVENLIRTERPMIVALQETLVAERHYPVVVKGYRTFAKPWQKGFRGQAVLVDNRLSSYELPHEDSKHLLHVKVSGGPNAMGPMHVFGVYLPSGGNFRKERTRLVAKLGSLVDEILKADSNAVIIGLGDFNVERDELNRKLRKSAKRLQIQSVVGSTLTRFPARKDLRPTSLDHFVCSSNACLMFRKTRVLRQYPISD
ncbi:DNase I-like protein, partial [Thelephora ganbajun]